MGCLLNTPYFSQDYWRFKPGDHLLPRLWISSILLRLQAWFDRIKTVSHYPHLFRHVSLGTKATSLVQHCQTNTWMEPVLHYLKSSRTLSIPPLLTMPHNGWNGWSFPQMCFTNSAWLTQGTACFILNIRHKCGYWSNDFLHFQLQISHHVRHQILSSYTSSKFQSSIQTDDYVSYHTSEYPGLGCFPEGFYIQFLVSNPEPIPRSIDIGNCL
jgi:hypothetical protein